MPQPEASQVPTSAPRDLADGPQAVAVELARGEVILFSDATTLYNPDVLRVMMPNFADQSVGCVAGRLIYVDPSSSAVGQGARSYWGYETFLKRHESRVFSLIVVSGCRYARFPRPSTSSIRRRCASGVYAP